ncbi:MAG: hypothetical protein J2P44_02205, partial [Candidatus Dormibacteraeota bacterium]|nr:hypothetical protein [Candidatus Dormibacteraeota bacterium]
VGSFSIGGIAISAILTALWKAFDVLFIGAIQAFIFMLLTIAYFGQAREGLEEHEAHATRTSRITPTTEFEGD